MDALLYGADVEKYSMGRGTGLRTKNWKVRHVKVTRLTFSIYNNAAAPTAKFEIPVSAVSLVFQEPKKEDHPEATRPCTVMVRLFDNGVYDLLLRTKNEEGKAKLVAALREATKNSKGVQFV